MTDSGSPGSPEGKPPAAAIQPSSTLTLAAAKADQKQARHVSAELRKAFDALYHEVEKDIEPDEEQPEPDLKKSLQLALLGIELASSEQKAIRLEATVVSQELDAGLLHQRAAEQRLIRYEATLSVCRRRPLETSQEEAATR